MSRLKFIAILTALLMLSHLASFGEKSLAQAQTVKDTSATALLATMNTITGWGQVTTDAAFLASGVVSYAPGEAQDRAKANVVIRAKGKSLLRIDVQSVTGGSTLVINGDQGAVVGPSGARLLPSHAVASMRPVIFPFLSYWVRFSDQSVGVQDLGSVQVRGEMCRKILITRQALPGDLLGAARQQADRLVVYVSAQTALPVEIDHDLISPENPSAVFRVADYLSDFRSVGGIAVPFHLEEFRDGRLVHSLQLSQFQADISITDNDFALPAAR